MFFTFPEDYSLQNNGLTQSMIKTYMQCPYKFILNLNRFYKPGTEGRKTGFGTIMHFILENFYKNPKQNFTEKEIEFLFDECVKKEKMHLTGILNDIEIIKIQVIQIAMAYRKYYAKDFKRKIVFVENEGSVEYQSIVLRKKIDVCIEIDKKLYTMDHKTASRIDESSLSKTLALDFQHLSYSLWTQWETGLNIVGCYHNMIRNPGIKITGSLIDYEIRLHNEIYKKLDHYFKRFIVSFTKDDIKNYIKNLDTVLLQIRNNVIYQNTTSCSLYGECEYLDICSTNSISGYKKRNKFFPELEVQHGNNKTNRKSVPKSKKQKRK